MGRAEERLGGGGAPVDQQAAAVTVGQAETAHVHRIGAVGADHPSEAQVDAVPAERAQSRAKPVDLQVPVQRLLPDAAGRPAGGVRAAREVADRLLQAGGDGREVPLVGGDQRPIRLGGESVRKVEDTGGLAVHGDGSPSTWRGVSARVAPVVGAVPTARNPGTACDYAA